MIGHLNGKLSYKGFDCLIVDVGGVGYRVEVPLSTLGRLPGTGEEVSLHIHTYVREDALRLYGFETMDGLRLFERLIGVSGVGPRLALSALSHFSPEALQRAVIQGDVKSLTQISGVGRKTAERIVIDLGESLRKLDITDRGAVADPLSSKQQALSDLEDALRYLGYKDRELRAVIRELSASADAGADVEGLLKQALKLLK